MVWHRGVVLKSERELALMREAGRVNALALLAALKAVRPGVRTADIDAAAAEVIHKHGAKPAFLGYPGAYPYPAVTTISVNEELVHGIPGKRRLDEGDIVSIDVGTIVEGYVGDSALTVGAGDVSAAIQTHVESRGFNVVREYTGHGVGRNMHEDPQIPNYGIAMRGMPLKVGMTIALEPMVLAGRPEVRVLADQWTVASTDGQRTAHFEHTVAVTENGPWILTALDTDLDEPAALRYNDYFAGRLEPAGELSKP